MREQASARIEELRRESEAGQSRLNQLEMEEARLRETLLRISGAIQALEELLTSGQAAAQDGPDSKEDSPEKVANSR